MENVILKLKYKTMSDKYWDDHPNNPINDRTEFDKESWCVSCESKERYDGGDICDNCYFENYSECCGAELVGELKDIGICPECKEHI